MYCSDEFEVPSKTQDVIEICPFVEYLVLLLFVVIYVRLRDPIFINVNAIDLIPFAFTRILRVKFIGDIGLLFSEAIIVEVRCILCECE